MSLGDDAENGFGKTLSLLGNVVRGAVIGLVAGAVIGAAVISVATLWPAVAGAYGAGAMFAAAHGVAGAGAIFSGISSAAGQLFSGASLATLGGLFTTHSAAMAATTLGTAAANASIPAAAAVGGVASFTSTGAGAAAALGSATGAAVLGSWPVLREVPGLFKSSVSVPGKVINYTNDVIHEAIPPSRQPTVTYDNDIPPGAGTAAMQRGDAASVGAGQYR